MSLFFLAHLQQLLQQFDELKQTFLRKIKSEGHSCQIVSCELMNGKIHI